MPRRPRPVRFLLSACLAAMLGSAPASASTEPASLGLRLEQGPGAGLLLTVENRLETAQDVALEIRTRGGFQLRGGEPGRIRVPARASLEVAVPANPGEAEGELRVRAFPAGSSAFVEARVFSQAGRTVDLRTRVASGTTRLVADRAVASAEPAGVLTGRIAFASFTGEILPLAEAKVRVGAVEGRTDADGRFSLAGLAPGAAEFEARLETAHWTVQGDQGAYRYTQAFTMPEDSGLDLGESRLPAGDPVSEAAWVHAVAVRAARYLRSQGDDLAWWDHLPVHWPSNGDYFSWGSLHITQAHQWDVIGHELGHAVYFGASKFAGGGGSHKIDECYSQGLALSEGWATYFSGAIHLAREDEDARFEFLVPRRAPIRIENVPADVCAGPTNEWRVAALFWDFFDTHADAGDELGLDWAQASWNLMRSGFRAKGAIQVLDRLGSDLGPEVKAKLEAIARANRIR